MILEADEPEVLADLLWLSWSWSWVLGSHNSDVLDLSVLGEKFSELFLSGLDSEVSDVKILSGKTLLECLLSDSLFDGITNIKFFFLSREFVVILFLGMFGIFVVLEADKSESFGVSGVIVLHDGA